LSLLLRGGRLVDPASGTDDTLDVLIEDGVVRRIGKALARGTAEVVDVAGRVLCPGFIDMHVHLREPGQMWKEPISSGIDSAARGGFTSVACMPNTDPLNDSRAVTETILAKARERDSVAVHVIACVTRGQNGHDLVDMEDLLAAGACAFSDDGKVVAGAEAMREALERAARAGVPVIDHCEEPDIVAGGVVNAGEVASRCGVPGWRGVGEDVIVQRDILLAEETGGHFHVAHMSTARSADLVRDAKRRGVHVTCEVTPHHITLTEAAVLEQGTAAKMNPPLRSEDDRRGLLEAVADGTVDAIATDHAPHHADEKSLPLAKAPFGIVGLETAVAICLDRLVHGGVIPLRRMVELFTVGPAGILHLDEGRLQEGCRGDVTVLDLDRRTVVEPEGFASLSRNTPFSGWELRGAPLMTIVGGRIVHDARR